MLIGPGAPAALKGWCDRLTSYGKRPTGRGLLKVCTPIVVDLRHQGIDWGQMTMIRVGEGLGRVAHDRYSMDLSSGRQLHGVAPVLRGPAWACTAAYCARLLCDANSVIY